MKSVWPAQARLGAPMAGLSGEGRFFPSEEPDQVTGLLKALVAL